MRRLLLILCLLTGFSLSLHAEERLFYQPLNADGALSQAQWRQLWQASAAQGVRTLIVQWSAYGNEQFGGPGGWLASALRQAHDSGLQIVMGLYMDPAYYQRLNELDGPGLESYWQYQLGRSLTQQRILRRDWQLPSSAWYLPMELDDLHFLDPARRQTLQRQLQDFARQLDAPLQLSAFSTGRLAPDAYAGWLQQIAGLGVHVWWQDGAGTGSLPARVRQAYASALPCRVGIVHEAFRQTNSQDQAFRAEPAPLPSASADCHERAVFELRYRPWAKALLSTPQGKAEKLD
ncbi:DUF4434 family protein [Pseudomonas panipatensis]|uniref:DUF4434 domain-containing protein n=1 Tax=Pseudomonas panipatensis TaxID=428992 RepID=A0A1G8C0U7_9PSED|nr:DUF4434 family protein [Pseudomonas panipatensis]SDH39025.1 protein of unknown function [Pseudomonas panipatensis]SMP66549.1 protein of unknown function [Pseudomonas panipatensis]